MVVLATVPLLCAAASLTLIPVPTPFFLALPGSLVSDSKQAGKDTKGKPEKLLQHPGELYSIIKFFHPSFVLQCVMFTSNYDLTVPILGIILIFMPVNNPSKMKGLVLVLSKPL